MPSPSRSKLRGGSGDFDKNPAHEVVGHASDYVSPRYPEHAQVIERFRGVVRECVLLTTPQHEGMASSTSLLVEVSTAAPAYR